MDRKATPILVAFMFLSALEIPILPLVLPWAAVRYSLLVLGVWGLLWMLGLLASICTYPHVVDTTGIRLRSGFQFDASRSRPQSRPFVPGRVPEHRNAETAAPPSTTR
jgi:hypothetical protein